METSAAAVSPAAEPSTEEPTTVVAGPPFVCPECKEDTFTSRAHLGRHRRWRHGVLGKHTKQAVANGDVEVPEPRRRGRPLGSRKQSTDIQLVERTNNAHVTNPSSNGHQVHASLDPLAYALAIGSVKEFCRNFAEEHGIPTREFTRQFSELFLREARR